MIFIQAWTRAWAWLGRNTTRACAGCLVTSLLCASSLMAGGGPAEAQDGSPLPARLRIVLTGDPAAPAFITEQIAAAIRAALGPSIEGGARIDSPLIFPAPQPLERGFQTSFHAATTISLPGDAPPIVARTIVDVENADVPNFAPGRLGFRDDPERIVADGVLSRTRVAAGQATRVYYYHQNTQGRRRFCVVLAANDSVLTRVHVVQAAAGPDIDVMGVGHAVTKTFLERKPVNAGTIIDIAGGKPVIARDSPVSAGDGIVGALDLRVLSGGPVTLTVLAIPPGSDPASYLYTPKLADDGHNRHGDFDLSGFGQRILAFTAGGRDVAAVYGRRDPTPVNLDPADPGRDYGDYGVLQRIRFDLDNPTVAPVSLFLYEKPLGGVVRSSFLVNGEIADLGCVRAGERYAIARVDLPAHGTGAFDVATMTDGGSNYPLELGVTATPPIAMTPPISAADGCFPKPTTSDK